MADRRPGRLIHKVSATVERAIPLKVTGIEFKVERKWKGGKHRRVGTVLVNAAGIRFQKARGRRSRRLTWQQVVDLFTVT